jgi:large subunit ribosomal protein L7/L12
MDDEEKKEEKTDEAVDEAKEAVEKAEEATEEAKESAEKAESAAEEAKEAAEDAEKVKEEAKPEEPASTPLAKEEPKPQVPKEEPKKEIKVSGKLADIIKEIEGLTVLELADLVHALEQKFGVTAAAPMAAAPAGGPAAGSESDEQETQTTFNVVLADSGANKISVIKAIRALVPTLGLKEAKDLVDTPPKPVLQGVNKEASNEAKQKLEAAGAKVELQ